MKAFTFILAFVSLSVVADGWGCNWYEKRWPETCKNFCQDTIEKKVYKKCKKYAKKITKKSCNVTVTCPEPNTGNRTL